MPAKSETNLQRSYDDDAKIDDAILYAMLGDNMLSTSLANHTLVKHLRRTCAMQQYLPLVQCTQIMGKTYFLKIS